MPYPAPCHHSFLSIGALGGRAHPLYLYDLFSDTCGPVRPDSEGALRGYGASPQMRPSLIVLILRVL